MLGKKECKSDGELRWKHWFCIRGNISAGPHAPSTPGPLIRHKVYHFQTLATGVPKLKTLLGTQRVKPITFRNELRTYDMIPKSNRIVPFMRMRNWEELDKFKCQEAECREKPWKVRARTYGTKSPSRSEALRFIDSAKFPSTTGTKIDGSLVNFRRRLSNRHGRPRRMLTMDIRRTPIGLWARLRDSHRSGPQSGWSLAWTLAQFTNEPSL